MYCTQCGARLPSGAKTCSTCGAPVESLPVAEPPALAPPAPAPPAPPTMQAGIETRIRPGLVTLLAVLKFVQGAVLLALGFFVALGSLSSHNPIAVVFGAVVFVVGALAGLCGFGLLALQPFGRYLQIALSIVGLFVGFPFLTVISVLILIYMFRPGVRILFSSTPVEDLTPAEAQALRAALHPNVAIIVGTVVLGAFLAVTGAGVVAAIAIPNLLNAIDRGKQKRTMADLRAIGTAVESYAVDHNYYPAAGSIQDLKGAVEPTYIKVMPTQDGWDRPFRVTASSTHYKVWSPGKDGEGDDCATAVTTTFNDEICFADGQFVRYPSGTQQ